MSQFDQLQHSRDEQGQRMPDATQADAAIRAILRFFRCTPKEDELPASLQSLDEKIEFRTRPFGLMRRNVQLEAGWYRNSIGAMLATRKTDGRVVALLPGHAFGYVMLDAETGKRVRVNRKNEQEISEEAICFYPALPLRKLNMKDLLLFLMETYNYMDRALFLGMMAAMSLLGLLSPLFTRWLFQDVLDSGSAEVLVGLAVFMLCYSVSKMLLGIFQALVNARINTKQDTSVQAAVMGRVISLPASFFKQYASGELSQYASAVQDLCSTMMSSIGTVSATSLFSLIYIGQIFTFAPTLVLPSVAVTALTFLVTNLTARVQVKVTRQSMELGAKTSGISYAMIRGIQKIKLTGAERRMYDRWAEQYTKEAALEYDPPLFLKLSGVLSTGISMVGTMAMYYVAARWSIGVADYYAFSAAYGQVAAAFGSFASLTTVFATIRPTLDMAKPIMEAEPELSEGKQVLTELQGNIEISNLTFRYDERMPCVINDLSLSIHAGEYLAIVGATGCGKSTLLRLLLGFEMPQSGCIRYDGRDMVELDLKSLRRKIGTVMQDGKLFQGDIYSNIIISAPQLTVEEAWAAAEIASIAQDIRSMPMGMHTLISEGTGGISGGQKQRLMIARAVAPRPKVLMFDEATSALDNVTQKAVSDAIDKLDCTRIVIAHRLSTIQHADRIVFLENGSIVEDGTYEELIEKNGRFAQLVQRQRLDVDAE